MFQDAFLFSQRDDLSFFLTYTRPFSHIFSLLVSYSLFLASLSLISPSIPRMSPESKKFTLEGTSSNSCSRTSLPSRFCSLSLPARSGTRSVTGGGGGLEIYAPRISFLVCPSVLRKSKIARAYGADRDISIRYLDPLFRPSGRQLFFPGIYPSLR